MPKARRYIMHLDGDAFFVSVEAAKNPALRGKPVVTGKERGIASALSYEAKRLGITRAMPVFQIRREFPEVAVVDSDYESYAVFSKRMMDIVRRYADAVEEYSIDECFADFTGVPGFARDPRPVLERIKREIRRELGITVSLGLGPTKVLAKTASKRGKPDGLTIVEPGGVRALLDKTPVDKIWGIGSATALALRRKGVSTALELADRPLPWVEEHFSKPLALMWHELNGVSVRPVGTEREGQKSIMKTRTFVPASKDRGTVLSELSKNVENACRKARELGVGAREMSVYLKTRDFSYASAWCRFASPSASAFEAIREAERLFDRIFVSGALYRATGVTLSGLAPAEVQESLFGRSMRRDGEATVLEAVDRINRRYGRSVVRVAASERAFRREEREGALSPAGAPPFLPKGSARRLKLPYLGDAR